MECPNHGKMGGTGEQRGGQKNTEHHQQGPTYREPKQWGNSLGHSDDMQNKHPPSYTEVLYKNKTKERNDLAGCSSIERSMVLVMADVP